MNRVVDRARMHHQGIWVLSLLLGVGLLLRSSNLYHDALIFTRTVPAVPTTSCAIPVQAGASKIKAVAHDIAARFHVAESAALGITHAAFAAAKVQRIDPMLVLAVAAVESRFKAQAVNPVTGATGLMQVMPRWHQDKIAGVGGDPSMLLIAPNIHVGAAILAEYLDAEDGDVENALGRYLGVAGGVRYLARVRSEMTHLARVLDAV